MSTAEWDDVKADVKWRMLAKVIDAWQEQVSNDGETLQVQPGSSIAGDDAASHPYMVSTAIRLCLNAAVDHLHAAKTLYVDSRVVHQAALSTLARAALETSAAAAWILNPSSRDERVVHALQWYAKNMRDQIKATAPRGLAPKSLETLLGQVDRVALRRGLDPSLRKVIRAGYVSTDAVRYVEGHFPDLVLGAELPWQLASGFAHGRPWASLSTQQREVISEMESGAKVRMTSSAARSLYPNLAAVDLVDALLALHRVRATSLDSAL